MNYYQKLIIETLNCTQSEAIEVEEIMREDIFHSTLDWQTKKQLQDSAKQGMEIYRELQHMNIK